MSPADDMAALVHDLKILQRQVKQRAFGHVIEDYADAAVALAARAIRYAQAADSARGLLIAKAEAEPR